MDLDKFLLTAQLQEFKNRKFYFIDFLFLYLFVIFPQQLYWSLELTSVVVLCGYQNRAKVQLC